MPCVFLGGGGYDLSSTYPQVVHKYVKGIFEILLWEFVIEDAFETQCPTRLSNISQTENSSPKLNASESEMPDFSFKHLSVSESRQKKLTQ